MATITYKCPNCDGGLLFDPSTQKYHCEYCQSSFSQEELDALAPAVASDTAVPTGMEAEGALGRGAGAGSAGAGGAGAGSAGAGGAMAGAGGAVAGGAMAGSAGTGGVMAGSAGAGGAMAGSGGTGGAMPGALEQETPPPGPRTHFPAELPGNRGRIQTDTRRIRLTRAMRCSTPAPAAVRRS